MLFVALLSSLTFATSALAELKEGVISYEMTMSSTDEEVQNNLDMLGPTQITMTFNKDFVKTESQSMMMVQKTIFDLNKDKGLMLQEMMGKKVAIFMTREEAEGVSRRGRKEDDITYEKTDEYKTILGYECRKVIAKTENGVITMFVNDEIVSDLPNSQFYSEKIGGLVLEMKMDMEQNGRTFSMNYVATSIKEKIKEKEPFSMEVPKGYKEMTMEEFMESMKGMRGGM